MDINNYNSSISKGSIDSSAINKVNEANNPSIKVTEIPGNSVENDKLDDNRQKRFNEKDVVKAVDKANDLLFKNNTHLQFRVHKQTHDIMVKIVNDETGEVVKEIPPEKVIDMVAKMCETLGIFVDEKK